MNNKFKFFIITFFSILVLCSCSTNKETTKTKEITVMVPDWGIPASEILDEFKEETGINVTILPTSWEEIKTKVAFAATSKKAAADIFEVDWSWAGEFVEAGFLEKLSLDKDTIVDIPSTKYFEVNNDIYAIPYINDLRITYINKKMFDGAGIKKMPTNYKELAKNLQTLKDKKIIEYPMLFPLSAEEKTTTSFITLAYSLNGKLFNDDNTLNKKTATLAIDLLKDYIDKGYINKTNVSTPGIDIFRGLNNANGAVLIGPTSYLISSNDENVSKVVGQITSIPLLGLKTNAKNTLNFTEALGISSYSENKEEAKLFVDWLTSKEIQLKLQKQSNIAPTRTSVIKELVDNKIITNAPSLVEQSKIVSSPFPNGVPSYYSQMSKEIYNTINQLPNLSTKEAVKQLEDKINALAMENK